MSLLNYANYDRNEFIKSTSGEPVSRCTFIRHLEIFFTKSFPVLLRSIQSRIGNGKIK
jgi:hypothetical protein